MPSHAYPLPSTVCLTLTPHFHAVILFNSAGTILSQAWSSLLPPPPTLPRGSFTLHDGNTPLSGAPPSVFSIFPKDTLLKHLNFFFKNKTPKTTYVFPLSLHHQPVSASLCRYTTLYNGTPTPTLALTLNNQPLSTPTFDPVTNLPTRIQSLQFLSSNPYPSGSVILLDLKKFSELNSTHGLTTGNAALRHVADQLCELLPPSPTPNTAPSFIGKFADDQFLIALPHLTHPKTIDDIRHACQKPLYQNLSPIHLDVHIGWASFPSPAPTPLLALDLANHALLLSKHNNSPPLEATTKLQTTTNRRNSIKQLIAPAFNNGEFSLEYQPFVNNHSSITGAEVLMRWHQSKIGRVFPDEFISLAEESDLINLLGDWSLKHSCKTITSHSHLLPSPFKLSVNMSPKQLVQDDIVSTIQDILTLTNFNPAHLQLEITENLLISNKQQALQKLTDLANMGITLALDDFGKGYSSLSYLHEFPFKVLKLDKSFVDFLDTPNHPHTSTCKNIINLAHDLHMTVTAEGVERLSQFQILQHLQCDSYQGYYFHKPNPLSTLLQVCATSPAPNEITP